MRSFKALALSLSVLFAFVLVLPVFGQERALTFTDLMQLREIEQASIADDGDWIAFTAEPDRGDPEVIVRAVDGSTRYLIPLGSHAVISGDGAFVAARLNPSMAEREKTGKGDAPRRGMALLNTATGEVESISDVQSFAFSADGHWLAYHKFEAKDEEGEDKAGEEEVGGGAEPSGGAEAGESGEQGEKTSAPGKRKPGTVLVLRNLASGDQVEVADVRSFSIADDGANLAYAVANADNSGDGLYVRSLSDSAGSQMPVDTRPFGHYEQLTWAETGPALAFVVAVEDQDGEPGKGTVMAWDGSDARELVSSADAPAGWFVPTTNSLRWSDDGERLFFGWRPVREDEKKRLEDSAEAEIAEVEIAEAGEADADKPDADEPFDPYDTEAILADRTVDVWHWLDPRINTQQKILWNREKNRTYMSVVHVDSGSIVALADPKVPDVTVPDNARVALMRSDVPYRWEATGTGGNSDAYVVDLTTGDRTMVAERLDGRAFLSPDGKFAVYYRDGAYFLFDVASGEARNITNTLGVPIANEDHDYPQPAPGYGLGGWTENDAAVLVYDKYDIWVIPTDGSAPWSLTEGQGRAETRIFRVIDTDPDQAAIGATDELLLSSYHDLNKGFGFYTARVDQPGVTRLIEEDKMFRFTAKAEDADTVLFTRQDYDEFPDLWVADNTRFANPRKLTDVNPNISEFAWGTSELTDWLSLDGIPLQGVQHLIDIGLADPDAIALHGHSWSGYQTAFMVTQTNIFKTAIAGAPVGNMTSAYSGIRLGSGLARQFQYEMSQSRLSGSLWDARDDYIDNSPVFFADKIETPMLILHGDVDDAVPWEQSIELYLAMRRNGKETVFLQYNDEPHHPQTYANKLDWAIKMKEWIDHYLKGAPAPEWISKGIPYTGK